MVKPFKQFLQEDIKSELNKIESVGNRIIERKDIGNYTILLTDAPWINVYQISITSNDKNFTTKSSQFKSPIAKQNVSLTDIIKTAKQLKVIIAEWLKKYQPLFVGTYNQARSKKYEELLVKLGFTIGERGTTEDYPDFSGGDVAWFFQIKGFKEPLKEQTEEKISKKLLFTYKNKIKIYLVNGEEVRNKIYIDFTMGGHGYVYDFIPKDEIWIEDLKSTFDKSCVFLHELIERYLMKNDEMGYEDAHAISTRLEIKIRNIRLKKS